MRSSAEATGISEAALTLTSGAVTIGRDVATNAMKDLQNAAQSQRETPVSSSAATVAAGKDIKNK
jgi:hypothetical protein